MKQHRILTRFLGSQTGNDHRLFHEGEETGLSDDLAAIAVKEGWAVEMIPGVEFVEMPIESESGILAENRETKVESPEETKPAKKKAKK